MAGTHEQVAPGAEQYLGFARNKLAFLADQRQQCGLPVMSWGPNTFDGVTITVTAADWGNTIRIDISAARGFLFHPRSGAVIQKDFIRVDYVDGYLVNIPETHTLVDGTGTDFAGKAIAGAATPSPLVDDDHGSRMIYQDENGAWQYEAQPEENYGNIDWIGPNTAGAGDPSAAVVLTWKGPPSRHFPLDKYLSVPGLTTLDEETGEDGHAVYTVFGPNIYSGGEIYATAPALGTTKTKVMGAALFGNILVAVLGITYRGVNPPYGGAAVFYFELWMLKESWSRLAHRVGERPSSPFFFNQSGSEAQCVTPDWCYKVNLSVDTNGIYSGYFTRSDVWGTDENKFQTSIAASEVDTQLQYDPPFPDNSIGGLRITRNCDIRQSGKKLIAVDYIGDVAHFRYVNHSGEWKSDSVDLNQKYTMMVAEVGSEESASSFGWYGAPDIGWKPDVYMMCHIIFNPLCGELAADGTIISFAGCCDGILKVDGTSHSDETGESFTYHLRQGFVIHDLTLDGPSYGVTKAGDSFFASGGIAPYTWSVSGANYSESADHKSIVINTVPCETPGARHSVTVSITDSCGITVGGIWRTENGYWTTASGPDITDTCSVEGGVTLTYSGFWRQGSIGNSIDIPDLIDLEPTPNLEAITLHAYYSRNSDYPTSYCTVPANPVGIPTTPYLAQGNGDWIYCTSYALSKNYEEWRCDS